MLYQDIVTFDRAINKEIYLFIVEYLIRHSANSVFTRLRKECMM